MKSSRFRLFLSSLLLTSLMLICGPGEISAQELSSGGGQGANPEQQSKGGGIVTLYALDPLARAFCFHDGREGFMLRGDRIVKRCTSELGFNLAGGTLSIGTDANRTGGIVDLGTAEEIRARYGYDNEAGMGVGFATIRSLGDKVALLVTKEDRPTEKVELLKEAPGLAQSGPSAPIALGHIYLLRISDAKDGRPQLLVKLIVIAYTPNETVTLRWEVL